MANTNDRSGDHTDVLYGLGLGLVTVLSRIPFRSKILYHWDSVNLAFGMREFNIVIDQPQPPGYIVYVWLCRLVNLLLQGPQTTMVWIAVVSSGLAVVATYLLGLAMFGRGTGLIAALFLASSPLFWFYGEIALPHTLDACLVTLSVWGLYRTMRGQMRFLYPTIALLAVVGGVRQQSLIFLLPLILFALRRVGWWRMVTTGLFGGVLCLLWAVPLIGSCGGVAQYLTVFSEYTSVFTSTTSILSGAGWQGVQYNVSRLGRYLLYAWSVALIPLVGYALKRSISTTTRLRNDCHSERNGVKSPVVSGVEPRNLSTFKSKGFLNSLWSLEVTKIVKSRCSVNGHWKMKRERSVFLGLWCAPTILIYAFIHMGQQGMIFTFLPALMVVSATTLIHLTETWPIRSLAWMSVALVAINVASFVLLPEYPLGKQSIKVLSWNTLRNRDSYYRKKFDTICERFPPESTVILASDWRHVQWYLPEYSLLQFDIADEQGESICYVTNRGRESRFETLADLNVQPDPVQGSVLVIFDPELQVLNHSDARWIHISPEGGSELGILALDVHEQLFCGPDGFGIRRD